MGIIFYHSSFINNMESFIDRKIIYRQAQNDHLQVNKN